MALETIGLKYVLEGASGALAQLGKLEQAEKDVAKEAENVGNRSASMGKTIAGTAAGFAAAELGLKALKTGFQFALGNAVSFERQMDQVGAIAQASESDLTALSGVAKQLGADTAFSASEAASAMEELAAGGRSVAQIMGGEAKASVDLAAAGNYGLADSARTIATTMDIWKGTTIDTTDVVNRLAGAANTSRFGVDDMAAAIAQGGGVAATAGVSFQDFSTAIAATASSFSSGSDAGTSFKTFIVGLTGNSEKAKDMIKELGLEFYNSQGAMKPMSEIVQELHDKLGNLSPELQTVALKTIFGNDAFRTAAGLMKLTGAEFAAMSKTMGDTDASEVAKQRMSNLSGQVEELKGSLETLGIGLGEKVIPLLGQLASGATTAVNAFGNLPASTQNMIFAISGLAIGIPAAITGIEKLAGGVGNLISFLGTGTGRLTAFAVGIAAVATAADYILKQTTGAGLVDRIFGDVARIEGSAKAVQQWNALILAAGPNADKATTATERFKRIVEEVGGSTAELSDEVGGLNNVLLGSDGRFFGVATSVSKNVDETKRYQEEVKLLAQQLMQQNVPLFEMREIYDSLPPALQKTFDATTGVVKATEEYTRKAQEGGDRIEAYARANQSLNSEVGRTATTLPPAKTAMQEFNDMLTDAEGKAVKASDALKILYDQISAANPVVLAAQASNALLNKELGDLKAKGDNATQADRDRIKVLEDLIKKNDQVIGDYQREQEAIEALAPYLSTIIGEKGYGGLILAMQGANMTGDEMVEVAGKIASGYQHLTQDSIPGAISVFGELKSKLDPQVWAVIAEQLGPKFVQTIEDSYTGQAKVDLLESAYDLGFASSDQVGKAISDNAADVNFAAEEMAKGAVGAASTGMAGMYSVGVEGTQGVASGLNDPGAMAQAQAAADRLAGSIKGFLTGILGFDSHSPSRWAAKNVGAPISQGVAEGINQDGYLAVDAAVKITAGISHAMRRGLEIGAEATDDELGDLLQGLSDIIMYSQMPADARKLAEDTITGWAIAIGAGQGLANQAVIDFVENLSSTIKAGAAKIAADMKQIVPGANGAPSGFILGSDGQWYPNEAAMPAGVTGASTLPTGNVPIGQYVPGMGYKTATGWEQTLGAAAAVDLAYRSGNYQNASVATAPAAADVAKGAAPAVQQITFDFSGANLTGTMAENETVMRNIVREELTYQTTRDAYVYGV